MISSFPPPGVPAWVIGRENRVEPAPFLAHFLCLNPRWTLCKYPFSLGEPAMKRAILSLKFPVGKRFGSLVYQYAGSTDAKAPISIALPWWKSHPWRRNERGEKGRVATRERESAALVIHLHQPILLPPLSISHTISSFRLLSEKGQRDTREAFPLPYMTCTRKGRARLKDQIESTYKPCENMPKLCPTVTLQAGTTHARYQQCHNKPAGRHGCCSCCAAAATATAAAVSGCSRAAHGCCTGRSRRCASGTTAAHQHRADGSCHRHGTAPAADAVRHCDALAAGHCCCSVRRTAASAAAADGCCRAADRVDDGCGSAASARRHDGSGAGTASNAPDDSGGYSQCSGRLAARPTTAGCTHHGRD